MPTQQLWEKAWRWFGQDRRVWQLLAAWGLVMLLVVLLPQAPIDRTNNEAFVQWRAEVRLTLGDSTPILSRLGLLTLRTSLWMRGILSLLALMLAVRASDLREGWATLPPMGRWLGVSLCAGVVLVLAGWGAQAVWGWKELDVIAWPATPITLPERHVTVSAPQFPPLSRRYGLYLIRRGTQIGLEVAAEDAQGKPLLLSRTGRSAPQPNLRLIVSPEPTYFALEEVGYILRVSQMDAPASEAILTQVYRSASGELLAEEILRQDHVLALDGVDVHFTRHTLPHFEAVYDPGAPFEALGILLMLGSAVAQRIRRREERVEASDEAGVSAVDDEERHGEA